MNHLRADECPDLSGPSCLEALSCLRRDGLCVWETHGTWLELIAWSGGHLVVRSVMNGTTACTVCFPFLHSQVRLNEELLTHSASLETAT